ncbi:hypothetical protein MPSI1_003707 [Malassezia psittaci]|uniref:YTH domain-containing protein n=1 Tax=Malassezia psittaci TaxID=1821823 RepID=A0AAF0JMD8_9BASI|nr:hypothetical protein MPSI1_003707 [Malassezia psittaci]
MRQRGKDAPELIIDDESAAQYTRATDCISHVSEFTPTHPQPSETLSGNTHSHDLHQPLSDPFTRSSESHHRLESNQLPDSTASITAALHRSNLEDARLQTPSVQPPSYPGHTSTFPRQQVEPDHNASDAGRGYYFTGYVDSNGTLLYTMPMYDMYSANTGPYPALLHSGENAVAGQGMTGVHSASLLQAPASPMHTPNHLWPQDSRLEHFPVDARRRWSESSYSEFPTQHDMPHHSFAVPYPYMYYPRTHTGVMQPAVHSDAPMNPLPDVQPEPQAATCDRDTSLESETPEDLSPHSSDQISPSLTTKSQSVSPQTSRQCDLYHRRHRSFDLSRSLNRIHNCKRSQKSNKTLHEHRRSSESAPRPAHQLDSSVWQTAKHNTKKSHRLPIGSHDKLSSETPSFHAGGERGVDSSHTSSGETNPSSSDLDATSKNLKSTPKNLSSERSKFVMWCGNVPGDASQEELWQFFTQTSDSIRSPNAPMQNAPQDTHGVLSIFIMSRSNCAFVNFSSARHLDRACSLFHDTKLRPKSNNVPLVCRARRSEDVEHAGVAAQRGKGVHTSWYRKEKQQQKQKSIEANDATLSSKSSDSLSFSSTDSSLLSQPQFAHRFFILKSRNSEALKTALRTNVWSTQTHNEPVLDQAFRNSEKVTLLFSENHSGHFFGYATMASRIGAACHTEDWRSSQSPLSSETSATSAVRLGSSDPSEESLRSNSSNREKSRPDDDDVYSSAAGFPSRLPLTYGSAARPSRPFYIRWVNTEPLPFRKINKLRNPWRDNRLVKVSRDGTELEPNVGRQLLSIWESST